MTPSLDYLRVRVVHLDHAHPPLPLSFGPRLRAPLREAGHVPVSPRQRRDLRRQQALGARRELRRGDQDHQRRPHLDLPGRHRRRRHRVPAGGDQVSRLTFVDLQELAYELTKRYGIIWRPKKDAVEMQIAGAILEALKIMDAERFKAFSTTIA